MYTQFARRFKKSTFSLKTIKTQKRWNQTKIKEATSKGHNRGVAITLYSSSAFHLNNLTQREASCFEKISSKYSNSHNFKTQTFRARILSGLYFGKLLTLFGLLGLDLLSIMSDDGKCIFS
eukprot:TRINITY_DN1424_c0_g1_i4.p1 TRINITY_DN1424_c0_g1~~TRINITY_DN1424_c0_g1_i4.p1  ORF type:complete len:121 (+),score=8.02 TRINITY_DN1424_c0_g1_i4:159-521(+)